MLAWLGEWLSSIVAIVLLAIIVELALPNNKMLRYARLVIGLILLLTMMNPILKLFETNFHDKLDASFILWDKELQSSKGSTPSIEEITKQAEILKQQRESAAVDFTKSSIEQAIKQHLDMTTTASIKQVELEFAWDEQTKQSNQQYPHIAKIVVTLDRIINDTVHDNSTIEDIIAVDVSINPITIGESLDVDADRISDQSQHMTSATESATEEQMAKLTYEIKQEIARQWNVHMDQIFVQVS